jgi:hypothetical protein
VTTPFDEIRVPTPRTRPPATGHLSNRVARGAFEDVTCPVVGSRAGVNYPTVRGTAPSIGATPPSHEPSRRPPPPLGPPLPIQHQGSTRFDPPVGRGRRTSRRPPTTPGWVFSLGVFAAFSVGLTFLVAHVVAPWIIDNASMGDLRSVADRVAASYFAVTVLAAGLAAVVGSWQSGRTGRSWLIRTVHGLIGPMVVIGVLVLVAWFAHQPIPSGPTEVNATLAFAAASLAAGVTASVHGGASGLLASTARPRRPRPAARYPILNMPYLSVVFLGLVPVLAPANQAGFSTPSPSLKPARPRGSRLATVPQSHCWAQLHVPNSILVATSTAPTAPSR